MLAARSRNVERSNDTQVKLPPLKINLTPEMDKKLSKRDSARTAPNMTMNLQVPVSTALTRADVEHVVSSGIDKVRQAIADGGATV